MLTNDRLRRLADLATNPCPISGYLPIHVAAANGRHTMYDFLVAHQGAAVETAVTSPRLGSLQLTPLQLACRLGNKRMTVRCQDNRVRTSHLWRMACRCPACRCSSRGRGVETCHHRSTSS